MKYYTHVNFTRIGFYIQEINSIIEINENYVKGTPTTIWIWGNVTSLDNKITIYRKAQLRENLSETIEFIYERIEELLEILKTKRRQTLENVKLAEEILAEEKKIALETSRDFKKYTSLLQNMDIERELEKKGIL